MRNIDLENLTPRDVQNIFDALDGYFRKDGLALITDNVFLKPEMLAKRWELSVSCLNNWRFTGGGPAYIKTGPGPKAQVRYPMLGENGILAFERQRLFRSTTDEAASMRAR